MLQAAELDLFMASYMAMRLIDDQIDNLSEGERRPDGPARAAIDRWLERIECCAAGVRPNGGDGIESATFAMLARTLPRAPFSICHFEALAEAMHIDASGTTLDDWPAFWRYCEGATVAPTAIYLTLMAHSGGAATFDEVRLWQLAQPMGRFCYCAHILRDLRKDARAGHWLLTVPRSAFVDLADDRRALADALLRDAEVHDALAGRFLAQLPELAVASDHAFRVISPELSGRPKAVLAGLLARYGRICAGVADAVGAPFADNPPFISPNGISMCPLTDDRVSTSQ